MTMLTLDTPAEVLSRLQQIEQDLARRQNALEESARDWFLAKREREKQHAIEYRKGQAFSQRVADCEAFADEQTADIGAVSEAEYNALRAVVGVLDTRAMILMAVLKSQGRAS